MNNNFLIDFQSMTIEQLKQWIISQNLTLEELETYNKGTEMLDKAAQLNNYSANRVWLALIAYVIYKLKGGKEE